MFLSPMLDMLLSTAQLDMTLIPTDKSKDNLKTYEEIWSKSKYLVRSTNNNSDEYDEKYMKIKFNSDDHLPLKKQNKIYGIIIVVRFVFNDSNKHYPQVFLDDCLYILAGQDIML